MQINISPSTRIPCQSLNERDICSIVVVLPIDVFVNISPPFPHCGLSVASRLPKIYRHGSKPFPNHRLRRAVSNRFPCLSDPMNPQPAAALTRPQSSAGSIGNTALLSTTASPTSLKGKRSRKRESSSASEQDGYEGSFGDKRRQPGVKRACNECRQQKVGWALVAL